MFALLYLSIFHKNPPTYYIYIYKYFQWYLHMLNICVHHDQTYDLNILRIHVWKTFFCDYNGKEKYVMLKNEIRNERRNNFVEENYEPWYFVIWN